ncbi:hypothetical protein KKG90_06175 [Candidatus Bipolaricaulota bacterium]|nr:hypothetical protein [Candidatus Bipolaricaulota bacterium]
MMGKRHAVALVLLAFITAGIANVVHSAAPSASYDIHITLDTQSHTLVGTQTVTLTNTSNESISEIPFALIGNWGAQANPYLHPSLTDPQYVAGFDPTWTHIQQVETKDGQAVTFRLEKAEPLLQTFSLDDGFLIIELPTALTPGATTTLVIRFETKFSRALAGDNCVYKDTYVWRFGWNPVLVDAQARLGQFQLPAADYAVKLTIPEDYVAFCGADDQQAGESVAGLTTISLTNTHPVRSVPLVISKQMDSVITEWNDVHVEVAYLPGGESYARRALSYAEDILTYHANRFGPFTGQRLIIAQNPTPGFFGMAANGLVLVGSSIVELADMPVVSAYDRINEYLLAHEIAHLWWGIGIGADFNAENWLSEGFAEYLSISYFEEQHGAYEPNLLNHLQAGLVEDLLVDTLGYMNLRQHMSELPYIMLLQAGFDEAIIQPVADSEYVNGQTIRTYNKGYLVLRALESVVGRETMDRILVQAQAQWTGELLTVADFEQLAEDAAQIDLSNFFAAWLHGDSQYDAAILGISTSRVGSGYQTTLKLAGMSETLPVVIEATLEDESTIRLTFAPDCCTSAPAPLETASPVASLTLDPDEMLPDANRFNNHWPRRILLSHPFQFEDTMDPGMPLDAYVIDISTMSISGSFRNDHTWSVMWLPHIDPTLDEGSTADLWNPQRVDVIGAFAANISRELGITFTGILTGVDLNTKEGDLDLALSLLMLRFSHPQTGTAGQYWYPAWQTTLTVGALGDLERPVAYISCSLLRDDTLASMMTHEITWQVGIPGLGAETFSTLEWRAEKRFRLAPLFYLDAAASVSESLTDQLPDAFLFAQDDLRAFPYLPLGHHQLFARLSLVLPPLVRDFGYALLSLTRIDSVTPSLFIQGGQTKSNCVSFCESGVRLEAGAMVSIKLPVFLGRSIEIGVGYAHPLVGPDGVGSLFLNVGGEL